MQSDKKSILCVDNDVDNLELLEFLFKGNGFIVKTCNSIEECLSLVHANEFSAVILDNGAGGKSLEVCREIRLSYPKVPIVFCSGEGRKKEIEKALEAGGNEYYVKPLDFGKLFETVNQLIQETPPET